MIIPTPQFLDYLVSIIVFSMHFVKYFGIEFDMIITTRALALLFFLLPLTPMIVV